MTHPQQPVPQPGGAPHPGAPQGPRRRTGLIAGVAAAVVVLVVLVVVLVVTLGGDDDSSDTAAPSSAPTASAGASSSAAPSPSAAGAGDSPRSVGDTFMAGVAAQDIPKARSVACAENADKLVGESGAKLPDAYKLDKFETTFVSDTASSDTAHSLSYTAAITLTYQGEQRSSTVPFTLDVVKEGDAWKVCGLKS